jgi:hypothetical protein
MLKQWDISIGFSRSKTSLTTWECRSPPSTHGDTDTKVHPDSASVAMSASGGATSKSGSRDSASRPSPAGDEGCSTRCHGWCVPLALLRQRMSAGLKGTEGDERGINTKAVRQVQTVSSALPGSRWAGANAIIPPQGRRRALAARAGARQGAR